MEITESTTIAIIGKGNVGSHLADALRHKVKVSLIDSRTMDGMPPHADIILIAVSDSAIDEIAKKVVDCTDIVAHTSGSIPMETLRGTANMYGVFYPMQTFTKGVEMHYNDIPFLIEGSDEEAFRVLSSLAAMVSDSVIYADSEKRRRFHLASVFACNFTNRMVAIADEILRDSDVDYKMMLPLLRQTIRKLTSTPPVDAQTGPAVRKDYPVMEAHLKILEGKDEWKDIYRLISNDIMKEKK